MGAETRRLWKGFAAGAVGGVAGSLAMSQFHSLFQREESSLQQGEEDSTVKVATAISRGVFHQNLSERQKSVAGTAVHYGFGAGVAAIYGTLVEVAPVARTGWGAPFGTAVWLGAHVITVPALGLAEPVTQSPGRKEAAEFGAHLVYGVTVESVRRLLRRGK
jgi:putative membrane protein